MNYRDWGALNLEQRKYIKRLLNKLDSADNYIKNLYLENQKLKENYEIIYNENCILREKHNINDIDLLDENQKYKEVIDKLNNKINSLKTCEDKPKEDIIYPHWEICNETKQEMLDILKRWNK